MLYVLLLVLLLSVAMWVVVMVLFSVTARKPSNLGLHEGRLAPCPDSPNCVCSEDSGAGAIEPLRFADEAEAAWSRLRAVISAQPGTVLVRDGDDYLHAECTSLLFRFVDDLEFRLDRAAKVIHVRSASRAGHSDLGVNRARVETIRSAFEKP